MKPAKEWEEKMSNVGIHFIYSEQFIKEIQDDAKKEYENRLKALSKLIWDTRWVSEEQDYQDMVGIAAEINSGNFTAIDKIIP